MKMERRLGNRGFIMGFLLLVVLGAVAFVLITFARPWIRYNTMRSHTKDILSSELNVIPAIREKVMDQAKELNIPLADENLEITMDKKIIHVKGTWSETVDFWGYYTKRLDFVMEVEY